MFFSAYMLGVATGRIKPEGNSWRLLLLDLVLFVVVSVVIPG
jgi:hypothetical protein